MKKIFSVLFLTVVSLISFSQARFGIKGGLNLANETISAEGNGYNGSVNGNTIPSFHIGGFAAIPIAENIDFRPELLLSGKGSNFTTTDTDPLDPSFGNPTTAKFRPYYLDIPLNFVYKVPLKTGGTFFIGAGPQFGIGLFGKINLEDSSADFFSKGIAKRFDFGINFIAGVDLKSGMTLSVNYDAGLANIADNSEAQPGDPTAKLTNSLFSFSVGYLFGKESKPHPHHKSEY